MKWEGTCYRAHDPGWAWAPLSGAGAAAKGGRFNPIGTPALYLALTVEGMLVEMGHGFGHRFDPLTICTYDVDVDDIIDLRTDAGRAAEGIDLASMACPWAYDLATGNLPAVASVDSWANAHGGLGASLALGDRRRASQ